MDQSVRVGIVGGGQLGRMLTEAANKMNISVAVVDNNENCPAAQVGAQQIKGDFHDQQAIKKLADISDVLTIESEHIDADFLDELANLGKPVYPDPKVIKTIQDKFSQKQHLAQIGVPVAEFSSIDGLEDATKVLQDFGGQFILKSRKGGFDGRGNVVVRSEDELSDAFESLGKTELYAEKLIDFKQEIAVMAAYSKTADIATYPVVETVQARNICLEVYAPAEIDKNLSDQAIELTQKIIRSYKTPGVFGIEMFVTQDDKVIINEVAPRVHNSGHYTIEACQTSQFEQHLRCITGRELGNTDLKAKTAVMVNILGERDGETLNRGIDEASKIPDTYIHLYGKSPTKIDRKMGHLTSLANDHETSLKNARSARRLIEI